MDNEKIIAFIIAFILDALDIVAIPIFGLPVIGDIADIIGIIILSKFIGVTALISGLELIPIAGDPIPFFLISTTMYYYGDDILRLVKK